MKIKVKHLVVVSFAFICYASESVCAQSDAKTIQVRSTENEQTKSASDQEKRALEWIASLNLNDGAKQQKIATAVAAHLKAIRDWHNDHPASTVPAGINPATGNKLSDLDRQIIATSAMPKSIHDTLMNLLNRELTPSQVETILDKYTVGKVAFTLAGYKAIVPDLTSEEEVKITGYLKQAREQAIDYKNMKEISAIFEIYKTKCELFLNTNGRNWRQLYKAYTDAVKAKKAAQKQPQKPTGKNE